MTGMALSIILDIALMLLLGVAIFYGVRLNKQMAVIRSGRDDLQKLIGEFASATERAEASLSELKAKTGAELEGAGQTAKRARDLCDDLEFLIGRGTKIADALERGVRSDQGRVRPEATTAANVVEDVEAAEQVAGRALATATETRPAADDADGAKRPQSAGKEAKAKSKSDLLKALQDMR